MQSYGVEYGSGGMIINAQGALISGANGIDQSAAISVANAGVITATTGFGVHLIGAAAAVTNSGTIQAGYSAVRIDNVGTVNNTGAIAATSQQGVYILAFVLQ